MRNNRYIKGNPRIRQRLIREAARLMYEEQVSQYHDAKRMAVKRLFGQGNKGSTYVRANDLPSNGEINLEVANLAQFYEGDSIAKQLFNMRLCALDTMQTLSRFSPRLIGSVSTGRIKKSSDIDIHVFMDSIEPLEHLLDSLRWPYDKKDVLIRRSNQYVLYQHMYIDRQFPIELSIYPEYDIRVRTRSSTDGKPIKRVSSTGLLHIIIDEHGDEWCDYLSDAETTDLTPNTRDTPC